MYFSAKTKSFYPNEMLELYSDLPDDLVEISEKDHQKILSELSAGGCELSSSKGVPIVKSVKVIQEAGRAWRTRELMRADIELLKVQDSDPSAKGTVGEWRDYRKALRAWPEHEKFPSYHHRPKAPDAE